MKSTNRAVWTNQEQREMQEVSAGTADPLSEKMKQNDRKQLTCTYFSLYPPLPQKKVKCHHLTEWI